MTSPADLTLVDLLPLLERRALSARELVEACLTRVAEREPHVRAFVVVTPERALEAATAADAARAQGRPVGALAGVPVAVKDLFLTAGTPTTASSRVLEGYDPGVDALLWQRLRQQGAGLLGKTVLHEFAYGTGSEPARNPWNLRLSPGGSSGGSAAALAARLAPLALGTDTGGSLRIPSAACGTTALRPATGALPTDGVLPLAPSFDVPGPMTRRMRDVALVLRLLGHPADEPPADLRGVRIGWLPTAAEEELARLCRDVLTGLGAELVDVAPPGGREDVEAVPGAYGHVVHAEALAVHADRLRDVPDRYTADLQGRFATARLTTPDQLEQARAQAAAWTAGWREVFRTHGLDAVASPTLPAPPPAPPAVPSLLLCKGWSVAAFPALSVPAGVDARGLPVGLQLAGLPERAGALVGLGAAVDEAVGLWRTDPMAGKRLPGR